MGVYSQETMFVLQRGVDTRDETYLDRKAMPVLKRAERTELLWQMMKEGIESNKGVGIREWIYNVFPKNPSDDCIHRKTQKTHPYQGHKECNVKNVLWSAFPIYASKECISITKSFSYNFLCERVLMMIREAISKVGSLI